MTSAFQPLLFTITNRMISAITHIERVRHFLEAALLSADLPSQRPIPVPKMLLRRR